jgi:hypothetical protein
MRPDAQVAAVVVSDYGEPLPHDDGGVVLERGAAFAAITEKVI